MNFFLIIFALKQEVLIESKNFSKKKDMTILHRLQNTHHILITYLNIGNLKIRKHFTLSKNEIPDYLNGFQRNYKVIEECSQEIEPQTF
jgi:hypothetical protein